MANLKTAKDSKAKSMGLHKEVLKGRTQQVFFNPEEAENFFYYGAHDDKLCEIFADLFLGVTPGGLGKRKPITRSIFNFFRHPYFLRFFSS